MEYAILFLPLIGSLIGYLGKSLTKYFAEISTSLFVSTSAVLSVFVFWNGIQNDIKLILTANKISSIDINITMTFFLFKKIPITPKKKIIAPNDK